MSKNFLEDDYYFDLKSLISVRKRCLSQRLVYCFQCKTERIEKKQRNMKIPA